jgi:hypothetical protein
VDDSLEISSIEVAFSKVKCNLLKRSLFPFLCLCQPENLTLGIQQSARSAHKFLFANFDEPVHELHSRGVKPIYPRTLAESERKCFNLLASDNIVIPRFRRASQCSTSSPDMRACTLPRALMALTR